MVNVSKNQVDAAINVLFTLSESIRALKEVPSGHLYAQAMGKISLENYTKAIDLLKRAKLVEERSNVLYWVGPHIENAPSV